MDVADFVRQHPEHLLVALREPDQVVEHDDDARRQREGVGSQGRAGAELEPVRRCVARRGHHGAEPRAQVRLALGRQRAGPQHHPVHSRERLAAQHRDGLGRNAGRDLVRGARQRLRHQQPGAGRHDADRERGERGALLPALQQAVVAPLAGDAVDGVVVVGDAGAAARQVEPARRVADAQAAAHAARVDLQVDVVAHDLQRVAGEDQRHRVADGIPAVVVVGLEDAHMPRSRLKKSPSSCPAAPTRGSRAFAL